MPESQKEGLTQKELDSALNLAKQAHPKWEKARENISKLDDSLNMAEQLPIFYWQNLIFGRGLILKVLESTILSPKTHLKFYDSKLREIGYVPR